MLEEVDAEEPPEPLSLARELKMTEPDVTVLDEAIPW